jgi:hypothetical protein
MFYVEISNTSNKNMFVNAFKSNAFKFVGIKLTLSNLSEVNAFKS